MTATSVQVFTDVLANPEWQAGYQEPHRIYSNISFTYTLPWNIQTLSTQNTEPGQTVSGLLYVPDLDPDSPCINKSAAWVPSNVTRQGNLPTVDYAKLIAMAPWVSVNCTLEYLAAARSDPIRAFLFFLPQNNTEAPPPVNSGAWGLPTAGNPDPDAWKSDDEFPVYAIPGAIGEKFMLASAEYSGNMTEVPHGHTLTEYYDSRDYVRLFVDITTAGGDTLPSLWIFLLVVLAMLLAIIGLTSLMMHWIQMRRRNALRRRVANGEVDLEALGIKRLTVPHDLLDEMPLYTYGSGEPAQLSTVARETDAEVTETTETVDKLESSPSSRPSSPPISTQPSSAIRRTRTHHPTSLLQPTCAICLDDFIPASGGTQGTIVRELPCQHIFHPECVDTFLRESSSLCPMCKKTALPTGYCPRVITNAMVRRERMVRQIRPRAESTVEEGLGGRNTPGSRRNIRVMSCGAMSRLSSWQGRRTSSAPQEMGSSQPMTEIRTPVRSTTNPATSNPPPVQPSSNPGRREWARQRAVAMLGRRDAPLDPDAEEAQTTSRWRKALNGIFPRAR